MGVLISFEVAKLAKKLGFKESCFHYFSLDGQPKSFREDGMYFLSIGAGGRVILRPTQEELGKWLRDNYKLHINVTRYGKWYSEVYLINEEKTMEDNSHPDFDKSADYDKYEDSYEEGLLNALKILEK